MLEGQEGVDGYEVSWQGVSNAAYGVVDRLEKVSARPATSVPLYVYGIPRGGIFAAQAVVTASRTSRVVLRMAENACNANIFIDDLIDSGATKARYAAKFPSTPFMALTDKRTRKDPSRWISFPWERMSDEGGAEENVRRILQLIGEDPQREGLIDTPARVVKSWKELFSGYQYKTDDDVAKLMKVFKEGACDEMVILKNIEFVSFCEHHMLPFTGKASIGYIPDGSVIGLSKLARLVDVYSRRLQIQERLTQQITGALDQFLKPKGSACVIEAVHECMTCRGVRKQQAVMVTSSLTGEFRNEAEVRAEFFSLIRGGFQI